MTSIFSCCFPSISRNSKPISAGEVCAKVLQNGRIARSDLSNLLKCIERISEVDYELAVQIAQLKPILDKQKSNIEPYKKLMLTKIENLAGNKATAEAKAKVNDLEVQKTFTGLSGIVKELEVKYIGALKVKITDLKEVINTVISGFTNEVVQEKARGFVSARNSQAFWKCDDFTEEHFPSYYEFVQNNFGVVNESLVKHEDFDKWRSLSGHVSKLATAEKYLSEAKYYLEKKDALGLTKVTVDDNDEIKYSDNQTNFLNFMRSLDSILAPEKKTKA